MGSNSSFYKNGPSYGVPTITPENIRPTNSSFYAYSLPLLITPFIPVVPPASTGWLTWELGFPIYVPAAPAATSWVTWYLF